MRRLLVLLVSLLAVLGLATPAHADRHGGVRPLTVLTFNIHHGAGPDGVFDLDRLAGEILRSRADVVGLQEVDRHFGERSAWLDEPAELARRLGMHVVFAANLDLEPPAPDRPRRQYGTAILSRYPIVSWHNTLLPKANPAEEQRGLLAAVVDVLGLPVRVMNTHFQHNNAESRVLQADVVADAARRSREPVVLTGDLNAVPEAQEIRTVTGVLTDTHAVAGLGNGFTYPVEAPDRRIDYVLASDARPLRSTVLPTESSDHRPVLVRLLVCRR